MKQEIARLDNVFAQNVRYKLTTKEQKLLFYVISHLDPKRETDFTEILIPFKQIQEALVGEKDNYNALYDEINRLRESLVSKSITFPSTIPIGKKFVKGTRNLFQAIEPKLNSEGEPCLSFLFTPIMKPFLLQLSQYVRIALDEILNMRNTHAIRMYAVFKSEKDRIERTGKDMFSMDYTIGELKDLLEIADKYSDKKFNDFKIKVLERITGDINENTSLSVDYEYIKTGKAITGIRFIVKEGKKYSDNEDFNLAQSIIENLLSSSK